MALLLGVSDSEFNSCNNAVENFPKPPSHLLWIMELSWWWRAEVPAFLGFPQFSPADAFLCRNSIRNAAFIASVFLQMCLDPNVSLDSFEAPGWLGGWSGLLLTPCWCTHNDAEVRASQGNITELRCILFFPTLAMLYSEQGHYKQPAFMEQTTVFRIPLWLCRDSEEDLCISQR